MSRSVSTPRDCEAVAYAYLEPIEDEEGESREYDSDDFSFALEDGAGCCLDCPQGRGRLPNRRVSKELVLPVRGYTGKERC